MKILSEEQYEELHKYSLSDYRQKIAMLSASFGKSFEWYREVLRHHEDFYEWAEKNAADMVIREFKQICEHDMDVADFIYHVYRRDLWNLVRKTYNCDDPVSFFDFYYEKRGC